MSAVIVEAVYAGRVGTVEVIADRQVRYEWRKCDITYHPWRADYKALSQRPWKVKGRRAHFASLETAVAAFTAMQAA